MRYIFSVIKIIIAVIAIILIIYIALQHAPFLKNQEWNPLNDMNNHHQNITQKASQKIIHSIHSLVTIKVTF